MIKCLNQTARDVWGAYGPQPGDEVEVFATTEPLVSLGLDTDPALWYFRRVGDRGEVFAGYSTMFDDAP